MRKILITLALAALSASASFAFPRSDNQLLEIANKKLDSIKTRAANPEIKLLYKSEVMAIAGSEGIGVVFLSIDDGVKPILGYTDEPFDVHNPNPALKMWMQSTESALSRATSEVDYRPDGIPESVTPFITTHWAQDHPYNMLCPSYTSGGTTKHYPTGCVATAMAQAMNYYRYPVSGVGKKAYRYNPGTGDLATNTIDLSKIKFDWDNMLDDYKTTSYNDEQATAVATLMNALGASIEMEYTPTGSGSFGFDACQALRRNLGYDKGLPYHFLMYESSWEFFPGVYKYLAQKYPIIFGGVNSSGGHCFILDGYDADGNVHINWGWGKNRGDGFFDITQMNGYVDQMDFMPLAPAGTFPEYASKLAMYNGNLSVTKRDDTHIKVNYSGGYFDIDAEAYIGNLYVVARNKESGIDCLLATQAEIPMLIPYNTMYSGGIAKNNITIVGKGISDGTYHVFVASRSHKETDANGNPIFLEKSYQPVRSTEGVCNSFLMIVKDGIIASLEAETNEFWFDNITSVDEVLVDNNKNANTSYINMMGQSVGINTKGLIIHNGEINYVK